MREASRTKLTLHKKRWRTTEPLNHWQPASSASTKSRLLLSGSPKSAWQRWRGSWRGSQISSLVLLKILLGIPHQITRPRCACPSCRTTASNNSHTIVPRRAERLISQFPKFPKFPNFLESLGWATIPCLDFIPLAHGGVCGLFLRPSLFVPRESV